MLIGSPASAEPQGEELASKIGYCGQMTSQLEIGVEGAMGVIVLNRPEAINALSREMIEGISEALTRWQVDEAVRAVLFEARGTKGFCAGGDVRSVRALVLAGKSEEALGYFAAEYRMNRLIAEFPKPVVVLSSGIVMGGGIGIAGHCAFRITQPGARFAMPEGAIGFFCDVGANAILAKAPLNRALLFSLSGASVGATDALALGLADAIVAPERLMEIRAGLVNAASAHRPEEAIVTLMQAESIVGGEAVFVALADLLPPQPAVSLEEFLAALKQVPALEPMLRLIATRSPSTLVTNFHAQLTARRLMDVGKTLDMDLRLAALMATRPDFAEGVRAVLVDKDNRPAWAPASLAELDAEPILAAIEAA
ncbi:MAG: enoyl-CoA hydratase/isomerase family protein [Devosia sp.]